MAGLPKLLQNKILFGYFYVADVYRTAMLLLLLPQFSREPTFTFPFALGEELDPLYGGMHVHPQAAPRAELTACALVKGAWGRGALSLAEEAPNPRLQAPKPLGRCENNAFKECNSAFIPEAIC